MSDEQSPARAGLLRVLLHRARSSFLLRSVIVMSLGAASSCSGCGLLTSFATWVGCNACSQSSSLGCGGSEEEETEETDCTDGIDDDEDGDIDCADFDCRYSGLCGEHICYDEVDDDSDGAVDCADDDCCGFEWCRCQCEAQCEPGTELCVSDDETCAHECCGAGQECVDGRCAACANGCDAGLAACWSADERCAVDCCTPGQECGDGGCRCRTDCEAGTRACLLDEWSCSFECCGEGDVCRSEGCEPIACAAAVVVDTESLELRLAWSELDDAVNVAGLDGCSASAGAEALLAVRVPAGEGIVIDSDQGLPTPMHVLDGCPPTRCLSSLGGATGAATLWINASAEENRVLVLLESDGDEPFVRELRVSRLTGRTCDDAIEVSSPADGFWWTANAGLFGDGSETGPCGLPARRRSWLTLDVSPGERLDVAAWGDDDGFDSSIAVVGGSCGEPTCLTQGADTVTLLNDLGQVQRLLVVVGWSASYQGDVNVDLSTSE